MVKSKEKHTKTELAVKSGAFSERNEYFMKFHITFSLSEYYADVSKLPLWRFCFDIRDFKV